MPSACNPEAGGFIAWCELQVRNTFDRRAVWVTTKENAPGGKRTEKVGLPYDPDLFDHMVEHGVYIEVRCISLLLPVHQSYGSD